MHPEAGWVGLAPTFEGPTRGVPANMGSMHAEDLWNGESFGARLSRALLTPASWLYAIGWQGYLALYRLGIKKPKAPHRPVVCVGNLISGGSGKTPATVHTADVLRDLGREVAISCSGYGSPASEAARLAPEGELRAAEWGDEAAMIRWLRPELPLIVGRRRVLAAEICHREFPGSVLLMDDGFQHLPLEKHLSILIEGPGKNRRCLPAGPYREPWQNRTRADLTIAAGSGDPGGFRLAAAAESFVGPSGAAIDLAGEISVLCAIGRPGEFLESLRRRRLTAGRVSVLPDHDPLAAGNLLDGFRHDLPIVVTAKDWMKLRDRPDVGGYRFVIAMREIEIEPRDAFRGWLEKRLNGIPNEEA